MIPDGWHYDKLGSCLTKKPEYGANESAVPYDPINTIRYIRITDINNSGALIEDRKVGIPLDVGQSYKLSEGDILVARTGATVGKSFLYKKNVGECAFAGYLIRLQCEPAKLMVQFLQQYLKSPLFWKWVHFTVKVGAQPNISAEQYAKLPIPRLPIKEQKNIVNILSIWDQACGQAQNQIDAKTRLRDGLVRSLIQSKDTEYNEMKMGDLLKPVARPVSRPCHEYQALGLRSHGKGTFKRIVDEPAKVMMDTLYEVERNDLIVNITFAWEGAIALVNAEDVGCLVSHRFPTYRIHDDVVLPDYLRYMILIKQFVYDLGVISPGGAGRNRVLSKKNFLKLSIRLPDISEQRRIASLLTEIDRGIDTLISYLKCLKMQKKGLMQVLLTGKVRINPNASKGGAK